MIASLRGRLTDDAPDRTVIDVGGVGYRVTCSQQTLTRLRARPDDLALRVHTYVREHAITLYGFHDATEETLFTLLISVHGVGPAAALAILNRVQTGQFLRAVADEDPAPFQGAPGIGRKTALRIVNELHGKIPDTLATDAAPADPADSARALARAALANLGYRDREVDGPLAEAVRAHPDADAPAMVRAALRAGAARPGRDDETSRAPVDARADGRRNDGRRPAGGLRRRHARLRHQRGLRRGARRQRPLTVRLH